MKNLKNIKDNKFINILCKIVKGIIIIIILAFIVTIYLQRLSKNEFSFFNYRMFTVVTDSMEPRYNVGDVLFAKEKPASEIKAGDDISYKGLVGDVKDKIITHEVVSVMQDESGKYHFNAKGLKNIVQDPVVHENQLYGVIVSKSLTLSFIYKIINTNIGFFCFIILPIVGIISYELISTMLNREEKRRNQN
ncbi:MAG: signal peptidase I [Bacilli bacterium]|nr:signal peptidase I [Bacilli bacterium]